MSKRFSRLWMLIAILTLQGFASVPASDLNKAVTLYHQSRYDSSLANLEALRLQGPMKRRDSLTLFQYLGMASAKAGHDSAAIAYFSELLKLDSLFQFPKNEDELVLNDFSRAREKSEVKMALPGRSEASSSPVSLQHDIVPPALSVLDKPPASPETPKIGFLYGALPLGSGWMARSHMKSGLALGILQAGGIVLSIYASEVQSREQNDHPGTQNLAEKATLERWQWTQRISLSTAIGAYLFSLIAAVGD